MTKIKRILVVDEHSERYYGRSVEDIGEITNDVVAFVDRPEEFSLVLFTGGEDVTPTFYNDSSPKGICRYNQKRDDYEAQIFSDALAAGVKCIGICRGLQFLNVMNGGTLMHHINGHSNATLHGFETPTSEEIFFVNSLHHQMVIPPENSHILGWSPTKLSGIYIGKNDEPVTWTMQEIEAVYYPITNCAGVQYHPEIMPKRSPAYDWFRNMAFDLITMANEAFLIKYMKNKRSQNANY